MIIRRLASQWQAFKAARCPFNSCKGDARPLRLQWAPARRYGIFGVEDWSEPVAQLVEHRPFKALVLGSSPSGLTIYFQSAGRPPILADGRTTEGSSPCCDGGAGCCILRKSAYERSGASRGVDPARDGPHPCVGIRRGPWQHSSQKGSLQRGPFLIQDRMVRLLSVLCRITRNPILFPAGRLLP